jgi:hypothetical protein
VGRGPRRHRLLGRVRRDPSRLSRLLSHLLLAGVEPQRRDPAGRLSFRARSNRSCFSTTPSCRRAKRVRDRCLSDPAYANSIRWEPAFKQLIFRHDSGRLMLTISQNSIGNAITELLGVVVKRVPDRAAYEAREPALIERLLEIRRLLIAADLGDGIATAHWCRCRKRNRPSIRQRQGSRTVSIPELLL